MDEMKKGISRRSFMVKGTTAVGVCSLAAGMTAGSLIAPTKAHAALEFPVFALDVEKIRAYGYCEYFTNGGCGQGGGRALIQGFIDACEANGVMDSGWHQLPLKMTAWGGGGGVAWGGTCGSLSGALQALGMAGLHGAVGNQVIDWYTRQSFPLMHWDGVDIPYDLYPNVPTPIPDNQVLAHSIPESMLCHNSVSKWMAAADATLATTWNGQGVKVDRCSKVTGDTAAYAAQMVNDHLAGIALQPAMVVAEEYADCLECHGGVDIQGKQNCTPCHTDVVLGEPGHWSGDDKPGKKQ